MIFFVIFFATLQWLLFYLVNYYGVNEAELCDSVCVDIPPTTTETDEDHLY